MKTYRKLLSALITVCILLLSFGLQLGAADFVRIRKSNIVVRSTSETAKPVGVENERSASSFAQENRIEAFQGGGQGQHPAMQLSGLNPANFSGHLMCKDHTFDYNPIEPTTIFRPSDAKAECWTNVSISKNDTVDYTWYYRSNSSVAWVSCFNWSYTALYDGIHIIVAYLNVSGCHLYYPRAYKVEVYHRNSFFNFTEFFEITNGGLNSPRVCKNIEANGNPIDVTSRFTIGKDPKVYHYLRFDNLAYFNKELGYCHNFTTIWIQPDNTPYRTYSGSFDDYKDENASWNYWKYAYVPDDCLSLNTSTPLGNWRVEVYLDIYLNNSWMPYGPVATTPFIVGNETVADWTFMVYLDADNTLESVGIDIFRRIASVGSSPNASIVVQIDRSPEYNQTLGFDDRYGNWSGCCRFNVTRDMDPTSDNALETLGDTNMGNATVLRDFVNWTIINFPASHYCLVLWDHGAGCMGVCIDMTSQNDLLTLPELSQALTELPAIMDVVFIDACSMTMVEVAYQIKNCANVLVGPEGLGYAKVNLFPAPYDLYLSSLISNPSMPPKEFATDIVTEYIAWCSMVNVHNATMSAVDLTKIMDLTIAVDDFATILREKETPYHKQISQARDLTETYPGPSAEDNGYIIDIYHLAEMISQQIFDEQVRNASARVMTVLSTGNVMIKEGNRDLPNSHGLSAFFPDADLKYRRYEEAYEETNFTADTSWDEFVGHHLSGYLLTIHAPYRNVQMTVNNETYATDGSGKIEVFLSYGYSSVNVTVLFSIASDSRGLFLHWNGSDSDTSNLKTVLVLEDTWLEADYETQYWLFVGASFGDTNPQAGDWKNASATVYISATPPSTIDGERYTWLGWAGTGIGSYSGMGNVAQGNSAQVSMNGPINETALWRHEYHLTVSSPYGSPTPVTGWYEAGTSINEWVPSPVPGQTGTRFMCTGWTASGNPPETGIAANVTFVIDQPSTIAWNWNTQHLLTIHTEPANLNPQPQLSLMGPWYNNGTLVTCTAREIGGYSFDHWIVDGTSWEAGVNTIPVTMDGPHEITAEYDRAHAWWEALTRPDVLQAALAIVGTGLTVGLLGTAWVRTRKGRGIVRAYLTQVDEVYARYKMDPQLCEQELDRLRNTVLEGLTEGRITDENYTIIDGRIDKYMKELQEQKNRKQNSH